MAPTQEIERCGLISMITNSTSKRKNRPAAKPDTQQHTSSIRDSNRGQKDLLENSSSSKSTSSSRISQKLTELPRLVIPLTPLLPSVMRHPTVLRAGPRSTQTPYKSPEGSDKQELFMTAKSSTIPDCTAPHIMTPAMQFLPPPTFNHGPSPSAPGPAPVDPKPSYRPYRFKDKNPIPPSDPAANLDNLQNTINFLYTRTSVVIHWSLRDRLQQLGLVWDDADFEFLLYRFDTVDVTMEKMYRIEQFVHVLARVVERATQMLVDERERNGREGV